MWDLPGKRLIDEPFYYENKEFLTDFNATRNKGKLAIELCLGPAIATGFVHFLVYIFHAYLSCPAASCVQREIVPTQWSIVKLEARVGRISRHTIFGDSEYTMYSEMKGEICLTLFTIILLVYTNSQPVTEKDVQLSICVQTRAEIST